MADVERKRQLSLGVILVSHILLGLGIYSIGHQMKNTLEKICGILFFFIYFGLLVAGGPLRISVAIPLGLLSWVYVLLRIYLINKKGTAEIKIF
ncbi:MAG: hypothetical protein Q7T16_03170 [Candidatus Burarchaeum sp.]|nr:hypothetical protein [Candidatus Burarchaeum sp.]MDO8339634.1 hypothetical protein [Candidatus Burarchaeum sp.]